MPAGYAYLGKVERAESNARTELPTALSNCVI